MSLEAPRRIFARQPRRHWLRGIARVLAVLAMMVIGAGGGVLLAAGLTGAPAPARQAAIQR